MQVEPKLVFAGNIYASQTYQERGKGLAISKTEGKHTAVKVGTTS